MMQKIRKTILCLLAACAAALAAALCLLFVPQAQAATSQIGELDMTGAPTETLTFAEAIGDNLLYQQNKPAAVWGFAPAGSSITVTLTEQESGDEVQQVTVQADGEGYFETYLDGQPASYTQYTLTATDNVTTVTARNILFGELFLSSGQSNMALNVQYCSNADELLDNATNPYIRIFKSPEIAGAATVPYYPAAYWEGGLWVRGDSYAQISDASAVTYNFAVELFEKLNAGGAEVPVGFLNASKGATSIEAWLSRLSIDAQAEGGTYGTVYDYLSEKSRLLAEEDYNQSGSQNFNQVSAMFNSKVAPLTNFYIKGILWYQGENNVGNEVAGQYYRNALGLLAQDWSAWFNEGKEEIPFLFAQVTPHNYNYEAEALAYMWEGMAEAYEDSDGQMSMVTTYDIPLDWNNTNFTYRSPIHPIVKQPVGQRFAAFAYNRFYGGTGALSSPVLDTAAFENGKATLTFKNASALQTTDGLDPVGFTLCGANRIFYPADAVLNADGSVTLSSRWVKEPVAAAYGFSEMIMRANVCSDEGYPIAPFRTDKVASTYYHPKDWQLCDATQYFVSRGSGTDASLALYEGAYTTSGNLSLSVSEDGDSGNALRLSYTLRGREEFWISPVLGKNETDGRFEQLASYDTLSFKVRNTQGRDVSVSVRVTLVSGQSWEAENLGGNAAAGANSDGYEVFYFSLNPTSAEGATAAELAQLRAQISDIQVVFRDYASGEIEVDSFDCGNYADLNTEYGAETPETPETPGGGTGEEPETPGGNTDTPEEGGGLTGGEIAGIVCGCVAAVAVVIVIVVLVRKRKK